MRAGIKQQTTKAAKTLVEKLSDTLRTAIIRGEFPIGSRLPSEAQLTRDYLVSRTVVREALAALRSDRLVDTRQGAGVFVLEMPTSHQDDILSLKVGNVPQASDIIDILELRLAVEVEAAGLAASRCSPAQEENLIFCHRAAHNHSGRDLPLHFAIAAATNNHRFGEFLNLFSTLLLPSPTEALNGSRARCAHSQIIAQEHDAIVLAILNRDEGGARIAMRSHLESAKLRYRAFLRNTRDKGSAH